MTPARGLVGTAAAAGEDAVGGAVDVALEAVEPVAPDDVGEHGEAERPEHHETDHHQRDGRRRPGRTDQCRCVHFLPFLQLETARYGCVESKWEGENGDSRQSRPKPDKRLK
ncbi:hypothetical protein MESS2_1130025 [Mesorhizobium metallidurans STM 2683]|uniref:Uncharacterized protein n=1 Tax=Mesorhizobium metallidurans STM 2683 TaxID=1297569 RepID=M5EHQ4_9HYPH|nr:hypothetical protein MESS2_1130025 [Mesorhizobium metallidurans STM 2683]